MDPSLLLRRPPVARAVSHHHNPQAAALALAEAQASERAAHRSLQRRNAYVYCLGRGLFGVFFVVAGLAKVAHFPQTVRWLREMGFADARLMLSTATALELVAGALLAVGLATRAAAKGLIAYLVAVSVLLWSVPDEPALVASVINVAFIAGLLMVVAHGPGPISVERWMRRLRVRRLVARLERIMSPPEPPASAAPR